MKLYPLKKIEKSGIFDLGARSFEPSFNTEHTQ